MRPARETEWGCGERKSLDFVILVLPFSSSSPGRLPIGLIHDGKCSIHYPGSLIKVTERERENSTSCSLVAANALAS